MNEEMRKEFEDFYINKYGSIAICSGNYTSERAIEQWEAWKASREAMKPIKFPSEIDIDLIGDQVANSHANSYAEGYNDALSDLELKITELGYKVE